MESMWFDIPSIAASGSKESPKKQNLIRTRTLFIWVKVTYAAGTTLPLNVGLITSPDGNNWDTVASDDYDVTLTANTTVQEGYTFAVPEFGYYKLKLSNTDAGQAMTNIKVWQSIGAWKNLRKHTKGDLSTRSQND